MNAREIIRDIVCADTGVFGTADEIADAILAAVKEEGYAVVRVEPTGHASRCGAVQLRDERLYDEEKAAACYRAMLAASQENPPCTPTTT